MNTIETPSTQGFRDFDLPVSHLLEDRHFIPPKAFDAEEIERRRELTRGTLVLERQLKGLRVAHTILGALDDESDLSFATQLLAEAGLNTSWYIYARGESDVMRRRLHLPLMGDGRSLVPDYLLEDACGLIEKATARTEKLAHAHEYRLRSYNEHQRTCGRIIGNGALRLAVYSAVQDGRFGNDDDEVEQQARARRECVRVLNNARDSHRIIGAHPSIAALSDADSHMAVYLRRHAPSKSARQVFGGALAS
jgi:hypothetical protein